VPPAEDNPSADFEPLTDAEVRAWERDRRHANGELGRWVRGMLLATAVVLVGVFGTAAYIHPYGDDGQPKRMATHTQLGLPECNMVALTGKPCPACGMTTSFSLLMHADPANSLKANWVGTLLAVAWLAYIPWAVVGAFRGKLLFVRDGEFALTVAVIVLLVLMLGRWAVVWFT
jgi:hypothetical protein